MKSTILVPNFFPIKVVNFPEFRLLTAGFLAIGFSVSAYHTAYIADEVCH